MSDTVRPTKKQRDILTFIESFIAEHGYSPSYREIMNGLDYTSVATVALHVGSLIRRGHLRKRDRSARSLEVVRQPTSSSSRLNATVQPADEKWLVDRIEAMFRRLEQSAEDASESALEELAVLLNALKILGLDGAATSLRSRLAELQLQTAVNSTVTPTGHEGE